MENYLKRELYQLVKNDESIFDFIQESSLDGLWYWDLEKPENEWMNSRFWTTLGYDPKEMPHSSKTWQNIIDQDDLKTAIDNFNKHLEDANNPYDQIVRYTHKNGSTVWIHCRGLAIRDDKGKPVRMLGAHHDVTALKKTEHELILAKEKAETSEAQFRLLFDNVPEPIFIQINYRFAYLNKAALELYRANSEEDLISKPVIERIHPDYREIINNRINNVNNHRKAAESLEYKHLRLDNTEIDVEISAVPINFCNQEGALVFVKDITERKKTEELRKKQNEEVENFFNCAIDLLCIANTKAEFVRLNKEWENVLGYSLSELENRSFLEFIHPDDIEPTLKKVNELQGQNIVTNFTNRYRCKDGSYKWIEWKSYPFGEKIYAAARDITERMHMMTDLNESKEQLRFAFEASNDGLWDVNLLTNEAFLSPRGCEILGFTPEEIQNHLKTWANMVHPDDMSMTLDALDSYLNGRSPVFEIEQRLKMKSGEWKWILSRGKLVSRTPEGVPLRITGTHTDISEWKRYQEELIQKNMELEASEEEIRAANEELLNASQALIVSNANLHNAKTRAEESEKHLRLLIDYAPEAIFINTEFKFAYVNLKALQLFGVENEDQIIGQQITAWFHPDSHEKVKAQIEGVFVKTQSERNSEQTLIKSDGNLLYVELSSVPFIHQGKNSTLVFVRNVTERKQYEDKLQKSYNLLNNLTAQVPGVVYQYRMYPDGRSAFPYSTEGMYEIYEVTSEEVREDASHVFTRIHPDDYNYIVETILESARTQSIYHSEFRVILPKQGLRWRHCDAKPELLEDGSTLWHGIITDITERKLAEEKIKEQQLLFETMFNTITDAVVITTCNGIILHANEGMTTTFGYSPEEILGKSEDILYVNAVKTGSEGIGNCSYDKENVATYKNKYNINFPGETFVTKLYNSNGEWIGNLKVIRNIADRLQYINELKIAREKAEESDRLKTAFLHNISHEIRTPMNAIIGFSEFLNKPDLSVEKRSRFTEVIIQSSNQLLSIITDIVNIATIEAGQAKVENNEISINATLDLIYQQFLYKTKKQNIELKYHLSLSNQEACVYTDSIKLTEILSNLVGNAIKFTKKGSVNFGYTLKGEFIEFYVKDSGIGIPAEMHGEIFKRFRQVESSIARQAGGSGLGLSISKAYVELLGGKIWMESILDEGSVFYFTIPYNKLNIYFRSDNSKVKDLRLDFIKSKTILIAEDEESNYALLEEILSFTELNIIRAKDGLEALNICKVNPKIDLVLMDIKMPVMDGYEATKQIKEIRPNLPIIAQTAYSADIDIAKALTCGCVDSITKPISYEGLIEKLKSIIG